MGRATGRVAADGRRGVGLEWGEGQLFGNASGTGRSSYGNDLRGGPERQVRVGNRTYQVLIPIWRLRSAQVKSRGYKTYTI